MLKRLHYSDRAALAELYDRYFDRVCSLVFNQVAGNREVAEDIVQDTFLAALKSAKGFKGRSSAYTWLCSIAYHKVADHYRRQSRERKRMVSGVATFCMADPGAARSSISGSASASSMLAA